MAFQFPANPVLNQTFSPVAGLTYQWDGTGWAPIGSAYVTLDQGNALWLAIAYLVNLPVTGVMLAFAGSDVPDGWLLCDGSAISRTTYADLFAAIGTTYGVGNGSTTFNIPDSVGATIAGQTVDYIIKT